MLGGAYTALLPWLRADVEEVLAAYGAAGFDPIDERGGAWRAALLERRR